MQNVNVGDRVVMRKPHPCGSSEWVVYRVGADIGLRCVGCDRRVMLTRRDFYKAAKQIVHAAGESPPANRDSDADMDEEGVTKF
jgi:hypothetical protein